MIYTLHYVSCGCRMKELCSDVLGGVLSAERVDATKRK